MSEEKTKKVTSTKKKLLQKKQPYPNYLKLVSLKLKAPPPNLLLKQPYQKIYPRAKLNLSVLHLNQRLQKNQLKPQPTLKRQQTNLRPKNLKIKQELLLALC
jgi:hypothetical protein